MMLRSLFCVSMLSAAVALAQAANSTASVTPPPAAAGAAAPAKGAQTADEAFTTRVKTLEENVVDLKEKIFCIKVWLLLL